MKHARRISVAKAQLPESHTLSFFLENLNMILTDTQNLIWTHIKALVFPCSCDEEE